MIRAHSVDSTNVTATGPVKKKTTSVTAKRLKGKKSSCRKNYKRLKFKLKGLIEEGVILKETLRRKEDKLVEMSKDIHYILGRLLPYQKKTSTISKSTEQQQQSPLSVSDPFDQQDIKSESWDGYDVNTLDTGKNRHLNFSLPPDQLASTVYPPLTLPDNIFSES